MLDITARLWFGVIACGLILWPMWYQFLQQVRGRKVREGRSPNPTQSDVNFWRSFWYAVGMTAVVRFALMAITGY